jgi:hypothetical protein
VASIELVVATFERVIGLEVRMLLIPSSIQTSNASTRPVRHAHDAHSFCSGGRSRQQIISNPVSRERELSRPADFSIQAKVATNIRIFVLTPLRRIDHAQLHHCPVRIRVS